MDFYVVLCNDVLIQILHCAKRHQLVKLQQIGRRFLFVVDVHFIEKPFMIFSLWNREQYDVVLLTMLLLVNLPVNLPSPQLAESQLAENVKNCPKISKNYTRFQK